jgi:hypothetical protein
MNVPGSDFRLLDMLRGEVLLIVERALRTSREGGHDLSEAAEIQLREEAQDAALLSATVLVLYALLKPKPEAMVCTTAEVGISYLRNRPDLLRSLQSQPRAHLPSGLSAILDWLGEAAETPSTDPLPPFPLAPGSA